MLPAENFQPTVQFQYWACCILQTLSTAFMCLWSHFKHYWSFCRWESFTWKSKLAWFYLYPFPRGGKALRVQTCAIWSIIDAWVCGSSRLRFLMFDQIFLIFHAKFGQSLHMASVGIAAKCHDNLHWHRWILSWNLNFTLYNARIHKILGLGQV